MHPDAGGVRVGEQRRQRVERRRLAREIGRARLDGAGVVGVAAAAHLHQQRVETLLLGRADERGDAGGGGQRRAKNPQRARFGRAILRPHRDAGRGGVEQRDHSYRNHGHHAAAREQVGEVHGSD
jgi:hypothetical protein